MNLTFDYSLENPLTVTETAINMYVNGSVNVENKERNTPANPSVPIPTDIDDFHS